MSQSASSSDILLVDYPQDFVAVLTLHRPAQRNAINTRLLAEIAEFLAQAASDDKIRVVVVTGGEKIFAAGADIHELAAHDAISTLSDPRPELWQKIAKFPKPIIASVQGAAFGAGLELVMNCDLVIASHDAKFGQPEINLGLIPGAGGTQRLIRAVGKSLASQMVLSGLPITAQTALTAGLISEIVCDEPPMQRALALASILVAKSPLALRLAKSALLQSFEFGLEAGLKYERQNFALLAASHDRAEGIDAFLGKRTPNFTGK